MNPFEDVHIHEGSTLGSQISSIASITRLPCNVRQIDRSSDTDSTIGIQVSNYESLNPFNEDPTYDRIPSHSKLSSSTHTEPNLNISLTDPFGLSTSSISATNGSPSRATRLCRLPKCVGTPGQNPLTGICAQASESPGSPNPFLSSFLPPKPQPKNLTGLPRGNGVGEMGPGENSGANSLAVCSDNSKNNLMSTNNASVSYGLKNQHRYFQDVNEAQIRGYKGLLDKKPFTSLDIRTVNLPDKNVLRISSKTLPDENVAPNRGGGF